MNRFWLKSYPSSVPADVDPARLTSLAELLRQACTAYRDRPAYEQMGRLMTFGQLDQLTRDFAAWLQGAGLMKGDRIAIMLPNTLQYPIALFGALRVGLTVVNTNPLYTARELQHQLEDSGAKAILVLENFAHVVQEVAGRTRLEKVLVTAAGDFLGFPKSWIVNYVVRHRRKQVPKWHIPGAVSFRDALRAGHGRPLNPVDVGPEDIAF
ncbi:MAG TPA: AMP-binding protein, partial [Steroidobacteraceae bacterium]|nr:AMP-binding protein [Steroidobacteraceae bacterium]